MGFSLPSYKSVDKWGFGGYLPGGSAPIHEGGGIPGVISDGVSSGGSWLKGTSSSAWDVLSGERDYRRGKRDAIEARDWTAEREDNAIQRRQADLAAAGINPMIAGQIGGADASTYSVPRSNSAESVSRGLSLAGSVISGGVSAYKGVAEAGLIKANTARSLADTAIALKKVDPEIAAIVAGTAVQNATVPMHQSTTALNVAKTTGQKISNQQQRYIMPKFKTEGDYYRKYGINAHVAKNSPQGIVVLAGHDSVEPVRKGIHAVQDFRARANAAVDGFFAKSVNTASQLLNNSKPTGRKRGRAR